MSNDQWIKRAWAKAQHVPLFLIVISLLYKFFEQSATYHDEIINVANAANADIFNYAARPVFYAINIVSVAAFGHNTLALSFSSYIIFVVVALYTCQYLRRDLGTIAGVAGVAALAWAGWMYPIGIRGMPHLYPALFALAALYHYHQKPLDQFGQGRHWAVTTLLWLGLLSHPTAAALIVGFSAMVAADLLSLSQPRSMREISLELAAWVLPALVLWALTEALFFLMTPDHHSFVGYWIDGLKNTSSEAHAGYFQPYGFYFSRIFSRFMPMLALLVAYATAALASVRERGGATAVRLRSSKAAGLLILAAVSLAVISLEKWKFDRIMVSFAPIVSLAVIYAIFQLPRSIPRFAPEMKAFAMLVIVTSSLITFIGDTTDVSAHFAKRYPVYSASFDTVRHLPASTIAYLGDEENITRAQYQVDGAGKNLQLLDLPSKALGNGAALVHAMIARGHRYVILDVGDNSKIIRRFQKFAYKAGLSRKAIIYSRNAYELWELAPSSLGSSVEARLAGLPKSAKVGLLIDKRLDLWLQWVLDEKRYRSRYLGAAPVATAGRFPVIFIDEKYAKRRSVQNMLARGKFKHVANVATYLNSGKPIGMWVRQ